MLPDGPRPHSLELRNVSFTCTLEDDLPCSRLYSPPQIIRLLNGISFEAVSGEIHAIVGAADSGKELLLEVIARSSEGETSGSIHLDNSHLTRERFTKLSSFLSGRQRGPRFMTVYSFLYYTAMLNFGDALPQKTIIRRVYTLMREFDLLGHVDKKLCDVSPSAYRRALIANALVKDPVLLVVEDPCRGLEPICSYQLMSCLRSYAVDHNRIVLVSITKPRSDLSHLISSITLLFRGEVLYSGQMREVAAYLEHAGFRCPDTENPSMYLLTMATMDYETRDTYERTCSQAQRLVERFKDYRTPVVPSRFSQFGFGGDGTVALCYLSQPSSATKLLHLIRRSFLAVSSTRCFLLLRIAGLPMFMFLLSAFSTNLLDGSWTAPYTSTRLFEVALLIVYAFGTFLTLSSYDDVLSLSFVENSDGLYGKPFSCLAYLCTIIGIDITSSFLSATILLWMSNITWPTAFLWTSLVFLTVFLCAHFFTMIVMLYLRRSLDCAALSLSIFIILLLYGGGSLRSLTTLPYDWLAYGLYLNPMRYVNFLLTLEVSSALPIEGCVRLERNGIDPTPVENYCRWPNGTMYLEETFPASVQPQDQWTNVAAILLLLLLFLLITLGAHALPQPRQIVDKFRYV